MVKGGKTMKLRKVLSLFIVVSMIFSLSACSKKEATTSGGNETESTGKDTSADVITLTYSIWDKNQEPGMKAIAEAFEAKNPGIKVNVEVTGWDEYWTKLEAAGTGGVLPDIFWMHINNFQKYAGAGMLAPVDEAVKADENVDFANFPEGLVDLYTLDDATYAIPKDFDTIGLWYNKTMFDEKGIDYPNETWDWNKLVEVAHKLTDEANGIYGFAAPLDAQQGYYNFIYQNGGYVITEDKKSSGFDQKATMDAVQFYTDMIYKEKVSPSFETLVETSNTNLFESGKVAMIMQGSWMVTELKNNEYTHANCDVAVIPHGKEKASIYNGLGNVVAANSPNKEAAMKFLMFTGTEEGNLLQAQNGSAIPAYKGTQQPWIDYTKDFSLGVYVDMLDYAVTFPTSKTRAKWDTVENDVMRQILSNEITVENGCKTIGEQMNAILEEE